MPGTLSPFKTYLTISIFDGSFQFFMDGGLAVGFGRNIVTVSVKSSAIARSALERLGSLMLKKDLNPTPSANLNESNDLVSRS